MERWPKTAWRKWGHISSALSLWNILPSFIKSPIKWLWGFAVGAVVAKFVPKIELLGVPENGIIPAVLIAVIVGSLITLGMLVIEYRKPRLYPDTDNATFDSLYAEGVRLQNEVQLQVKDFSHLVDWHQREQDWRQRILNAVQPISDRHARHIKTLRRFDSFQAPVGNPISELLNGIEHQRWADIHCERLNRFNEFLNEHQI